MSNPTLPPGIDKLYQKTKGNLFTKPGAGFLGSLLCKLEHRWTWDLPTAAISSKILYWNPDFFMSLDPEQRITVLAHELCHNMYMHGIRLNDRIPLLWNIAGDHVINLFLEEHGYKFNGLPALKDPKYIGWATDDVYDDLLKQGDQVEMKIDLGQDILPVPAEDAASALADVIDANTAARLSKGAGTIPGEIVQEIDAYLNPKLPWEVLLYNYFNEITNQEYSYQRPNRRYDDPLLPGLSGYNGLEHLIYYLDISGSVTDEQVALFNAEVRYIKTQLEPELLTLVTFDTEIHDEITFEKEDPFEKLVITGRGGTDLEDVFEHARKHKPTVAVIFSDLDVDIPPNPGVPILWICVDNPQVTTPYGTLIHVAS